MLRVGHIERRFGGSPVPYPPIKPPALELKRDVVEAASLFTQSKTLQDVADVLEVHPGHLKHWLYAIPGHNGYRSFSIPKKSGGKRLISAPPDTLEILQLKFKGILDHIYKPKPCVYGFVSGQSIVGGARVHKKRAKWLLNIDIQDFYPSINFGRIFGLFKSFGVAHRAAAIWAHLVTVHKTLPQGAPTSPVLSNMIARQLDGKLIHLAHQFHLQYTRYADDISLSTSKRDFPKRVAYHSGFPLDSDDVILQPTLIRIVEECGFRINPHKTRLQSKYVRQEVTGLTVNEFVNVRRKFIRQIRAMVHATRTFGFENAGREYITKYAPAGRIEPTVLEDDEFDAAAYFRTVLYGKLAFLRMVRGETDKCYVNLCLQMAKLDSDPPAQIKKVEEMYEKYDVFIVHAGEDKDAIARPLHKALTKLEAGTFYDETSVSWGDSFVEKINHALSLAKFVVVVLSEHSVGKAWPMKELHAALACEVSGQTKVLPLSVGTEEQANTYRRQLPLLADKHWEHWADNPDQIAGDIQSLLSNRIEHD